MRSTSQCQIIYLLYNGIGMDLFTINATTVQYIYLYGVAYSLEYEP